MTSTTTTDSTTSAAASDAHERSGPPTLGDVRSFASDAEHARTLAEPGAVASIATMTHDGFPYTTTAPVSVDDAGAPVICVSEIAEHTINLRRSGRASVLIQQRTDDATDPLALARVTYVGTFREFVPCAGQVERHLAAHPSSSHYVEFADFGWWRLDVSHVRYIGGFGMMGWATGDELAAASPDPVIPHATSMIDHLNADHGEACLLIARHLGDAPGATAATVTDVDRYGVTFGLDGTFGRPDDRSTHAVCRVAFARPLLGPEQVREATVELTRRARHVAEAL